jgi:hypothetical protein
MKQTMTKSRAEYQRQYRERKAAKQKEQELINSEKDFEPINPIEVDVKENDSPKQTLKDRIFGVNVASAPKTRTAKKGTRGKQIDASLMSKVLPTMISGSIALYTKKLVRNPYKACAPTQQEVYGAVGPLFSILGRRIEIVGTASEDMIDLISALLMSLCTGIRMHITYLTIQEQIESMKVNGQYNTGNANGNTAIRNGLETQEYTRETDNPINSDNGVSSTGNINGNSNSDNGDSKLANREINMFAELSRKDRQGRVRLGLLGE